MPKTMAPLDTMQNDQAFMNLLSSQRALLSKLNMESAVRKNQGTQPRPTKKRGSIIGADPLGLMNQPIIERRGSMGMLFSRRLSIGMGIGNDNFVLPPPMVTQGPPDFGFDEFLVRDDQWNSLDYGKQSAIEFDFGMDSSSTTSRKMKRRRSSMTVLSFFEDPKQSRRFSLISVSRPIDDDLLSIEEPPVQTEPPAKRLRFDPVAAKSTMESFASAMEKSQKSQQDIHDWDRKMGLKRSHSKTMRLSSRSRKKLRAILKREIGALAAATR